MSTQFARSIDVYFFLWCCFGFTVYLKSGVAVGQDSTKSEVNAGSKDQSIEVIVVDVVGKPVKGASVRIIKWTGKDDETGIEAISDDDGKSLLEGLPTDSHLYLVVRAEGYAPSMQAITVEKGKTRLVTFKVARPVQSWIQVIGPDGKPIAGAEIERLDFIDPNENKVYLMRKSPALLGYELNVSDTTGRLELPPLPEGANVAIKVIHRDWATSWVRDLKASNGLLSSANLAAGVRVQLKLVPSSDISNSLDGLVASMVLLEQTDSAGRIEHSFRVKDSNVEFTAHEGNYQELRFSLDDYFVTPRHIQLGDEICEELQFSGKGTKIVPLMVRPKVRARGHVVGLDGKPVANVAVFAGIENLYPNEATAEDRTPSGLLGKWAFARGALTDANGQYEILLAPGKALVTASHNGFFSQPSELECEVAADGSTVLPVLKVLPVPTLRGKVKDEQGRAISGAVVRMRSRMGVDDPFGTSNADGSFEIVLSHIPSLPKEGGLQTKVSVVAFDAHSDLAGRTEVDLTDVIMVNDIVVTLSPQASDWLLGDLQKFDDSAKFIKKLREEFSAGMPGNSVPDLSEGTWLNTNAKSLQDFRGKYVLLDFWFIGCGPCMRDMPTIKLAHKLFGEHGFSVVSVHTSTQTATDVQVFANQHEMNYPIVVDSSEEPITKGFKPLGLTSYPYYILLNPEGKILHNDTLWLGRSLKQNMLEVIYQAIREKRN